MNDTAERTTDQQIARHIAMFDAARADFAERRAACIELIRRCNAKLICEENEAFELEIGQVVEQLQLITSDIDIYVGNLEREVEKLRQAESAVRAHPHSVLAPAFLKFIATDVALSRRNLAMALYDYDDAIRAARTIEQNYLT